MICIRVLLFVMLAWSAQAADDLGQVAADALSQKTSVALSPSGKFVLVQDAAGAIWLSQTGIQLSRRIGKSDASTATFTWSPDETFFVVTRRGHAVSFEVPSGKPRQTFAGSAPIQEVDVSPDGRFTSYQQSGNLFLTAAPGGRQAPRPLTESGGPNLLIGTPDPIYAREFGVTRHYWWAPDSSAIAFIETAFKSDNHYVAAGETLPEFRLKVADAASGQTKIIFESNDKWPYILRVTWHPDSKRIAFYRLNRLQTESELCLFDNGTLKTILTEKDLYWVNAPETPLFLDHGNKLAISSERTGKKDIYLYALSGELLKDLTPHDLEVYKLHAAVDEKGGIFVSGSTGTRQEQQLFRLDTATGESKQVTSEAGWHDVSLNSDGNAYLDDYSSTEKPAVYWWHVNGTPPRDIYHSAATQKPVANEYLAIKTHDNVQLPARLYKPDDFDPQKKYPMILYTFSGPEGRVAENSWDSWQMGWNRYMVSKGYLVLTIDVRGSGGYGHLFEEYIHYRFGAQETADLREVVSYLRRQSFVDGARLGIWGCDYGAHTVVHAMLQFPNGFKAGFADSPIIVWTKFNGYFAERYLGLPKTRFSEYDDSTALDDADRMTGTLQVASSDKNPLIRPDQLEELRQAFLNVKKHKDVINRYHTIDLPDADYRRHPDELAKLMQQMAEFFEKTL